MSAAVAARLSCNGLMPAASAPRTLQVVDVAGLRAITGTADSSARPDVSLLASPEPAECPHVPAAAAADEHLRILQAKDLELPCESLVDPTPESAQREQDPAAPDQDRAIYTMIHGIAWKLDVPDAQAQKQHQHTASNDDEAMTRPLLLEEGGRDASARETLWRRVAARLQELVDWDVLHLTWQQVEYEVLGLLDPAVWSRSHVHAQVKGLCAMELANVAAFLTQSKTVGGKQLGKNAGASKSKPALGLAISKRPACPNVQSYQAYVLWR